MGALTRTFPPELVDRVVATTDTRELRRRLLPARLVVYFVLALSLFTDGYEEVIRNDKTQVPFLGDVPVLGNLFKNTTRSSQKTELLIFLTPRIVKESVNSVR